MGDDKKSGKVYHPSSSSHSDRGSSVTTNVDDTFKTADGSNGEGSDRNFEPLSFWSPCARKWISGNGAPSEGLAGKKREI